MPASSRRSQYPQHQQQQHQPLLFYNAAPNPQQQSIAIPTQAVPPFPDGGQPRYGPSGPAYSMQTSAFSPPFHSPPPVPEGLGYSTRPVPTSTSPTLPFFEAALARARGVNGPGVPNEAQSTTQQAYLPSYMPPPDPNHPDLNAALIRSNGARIVGNPRAARQSRSPSPVNAPKYGSWDVKDSEDVEKALLTVSQPSYQLPHSVRSPYLPADDEATDLVLPPFQGGASPPRLLSAMPSIYRKGLATESEAVDSLAEGDLADEVNQHFGPAPTGRISRRTHNAAGHRRIKHTATLDDNGFFAIDMPIPTRLAQFLPFKGVEEQKTTRRVL